MDIGRSFTYVLEDDQWWKKVLLGGLLSLIPIVGQLYADGYVLEVFSNVIGGRETPLPEALENLGSRIVKGLLASAIMLIYALPLLIVLVCPAVGIPLASSASADPDTAGVIASIAGTCFGCISAIYGVLMGLVQPFAWGKYAESGQFGDAFKLSTIWTMVKANIGQTLLTLLVIALVSIVAGSVGSAVCGIGVAFTGFYAQLVIAFLTGKLYVQTKAKTL